MLVVRIGARNEALSWLSMIVETGPDPVTLQAIAPCWWQRCLLIQRPGVRAH